MFYVYIIKSVINEQQVYIGHTSNLANRLTYHNVGKSIHTAKYMPWELVLYIAFTTEKKAISFEVIIIMLHCVQLKSCTK